MKNRIVNSVLILALLLMFGCAIGGWQRFISEDGTFSIEMPGKPKASKIILPVEERETYLDIFMVDEKEGFVFSLAYIDFTNEVLQKKSVEQRLNDARDGAVLNVQGALLSEAEVSIKQYPGREIMIRSVDGESIIKSRFFLVGNRQYQLMVITTKDKIESFTVRRFLDSFNILKSTP